MAYSFWIPVTVVFVAACVGAATDVWKFRVYNILTIPLILSGIAYHCVTNQWSGFANSLLGTAFGISVLLVPYILGLMGGGDVKLLAGLGAWLGLPLTAAVFVASALIAGGYALALIVIRGKIRENWAMLKLICYRLATLGVYLGKEDLVESMTMSPDRRLRVIPFGAMVPLGIIGAIIWLKWM
jgi:prepilin peptidase CpaA